MVPSISEIVQASESRLQDVDSPRLCAQVIVSSVLRCSRLDLVMHRDKPVTLTQLAKIDAYVLRREKGEPLAYILGQQEFYGLDFDVSPDVLIPRPETEHIIEEVESLFDSPDTFQFVDLGTGSGIIAITVASLFKASQGVAIDLSSGALQVAQRNAEKHGVKSQLTFINGDFTYPLFASASFDLILSNPPYVPQQEYDEASHEVTDFEPISALVSGEDGLDHIRIMLPLVADALKPGGVFMMEIGYKQAKAVMSIVTEQVSEFTEFKVIKDLSGHDRIVFLRKK